MRSINATRDPKLNGILFATGSPRISPDHPLAFTGFNMAGFTGPLRYTAYYMSTSGALFKILLHASTKNLSFFSPLRAPSRYINRPWRANQ